MANFKKDQHNPRLMLDYDAIYAYFGEQVIYYLNHVRQLDQATNPYRYSTQKVRLSRLANLAWILMNQPADKDGCINLTLDDILNVLSDRKDEKGISPRVLQDDMHELGKDIGIKFVRDPANGKIFIKPMRQ